MHAAFEAVGEVAFPTATRVDLGLDDELGTAELACGFGSFLRGAGDFSDGAWHLIEIEEFLCLVFVNVHKKIETALRRQRLVVSERWGQGSE